MRCKMDQEKTEDERIRQLAIAHIFGERIVAATEPFEGQLVTPQLMSQMVAACSDVIDSMVEAEQFTPEQGVELFQCVVRMISERY